MKSARWSAGLAALLLAACGGGGVLPPLEPTQPQSRYQFANGCHALQDVERGRWIARAGDAWQLDDESAASRFFLKPTGLGSYLLQDADGQLLGLDDPLGQFLDATGALVAQGGALVTVLGNVAARAEGDRTGLTAGIRLLGQNLRAQGLDLEQGVVAPVLAALATPTDLAVWDLVALGGADFGLRHQATGLRLLAAEDGGLALGEPPVPEALGRFRLLPREGCSVFPEAGVNAEILSPPRRLNDDGTVFGWVDAHNHILGSEFLGGRVTYGAAFHPLGITHALHDCAEHHGPMGLVSPLQYLVASNPHETRGWPTFRDWPGHGELLHHQTYYQWMKRAFLSGQKLMVNHFVENEGMCILHAPLNRHDCDEMASIRHQRERLFALQDYIDAQEGGPGRGWFRIVTSPAEARRVIAEGQMAVVMGAEVSKVLGCGETLDVPDCSLPQIRDRLDELQQLGLRSLFPIHRQDNAFGGAKPGGPEPVNVVVAAGTITDSFHGYRLEACVDEEADQNDQRPPGLLEELANLVSFVSQAGGGPAIPYGAGEGESCNARGLTGHGEYLVDELMRRGMIIEIDHSGERVRDRVLQIAQARGYPVVSGHSWTSPVAFRRIWKTGGAMNMYSCPADCYVREALGRYAGTAPVGHFVGVGLGTDANGLGPLPGPRGSAAEQPLDYPFLSYDGAVRFDRQVTGTRVFDLNEEGVAHYGLYADLVADIQQNGGDGREVAMELLFRSAEAYLRMWERAEALAAGR